MRYGRDSDEVYNFLVFIVTRIGLNMHHYYSEHSSRLEISKNIMDFFLSAIITSPSTLNWMVPHENLVG